MAVTRSTPSYSGATNVADLLERVLDKGVVIAGDVKVSLLDIELLTIQLRLVVCSIDKAQEMGLDWWANSPVFGSAGQSKESEKHKDETIRALQERLDHLETSLSTRQPAHSPEPESRAVRFKPITPPDADAT